MQESYGEGLAIHTGPESCGRIRKDTIEALTGVCAGRVLSRVIVDNSPERRCCRKCRKATPVMSISQDMEGLRAVGDPVHVHKLLAQELGGPPLVLSDGGQDRATNPCGVRWR